MDEHPLPVIASADSAIESRLSRRNFLAGVTATGVSSAALPSMLHAENTPSVEPGGEITVIGNKEIMSAMDDAVTAAKIRRALLAGPASITKDATVVEVDGSGKTIILRQGTNKWICMPGDENRIGDVPMCADPVAMQWFADAEARKPKPTNVVPGICYMLCGATQRSNTDPFDTTSPPIPIGPHWMILWPFDANATGLPTTVRDKGAWVMFAESPYAYLHICGTPWDGNEYKGDDAAVWTMAYPRE